MSKKIYDVSTICNALVDIIMDAKDEDLNTLEMTKGIMHLVDTDRQHKILEYFRGSREVIELGGSALNAIRVLAALGKKTVFMGMVGQDDFGLRIRERTSEIGVRSHLADSDTPTGSCVILVTPDGERTMNTALGASCLYNEQLVHEDDIQKSRVFHFCGYQWATPGQKAAIKRAIRTAKAAGTKISFDLADPFVVRENREDFWNIINEDADIVFANREEAHLLFETSPEQAAAKIAETGAIAAVKLGSEGSLVQQGHISHRIQPIKTQVVDTTAAGDVYAAGFLYGYTTERELPVCGQIAGTLAADVISRYGAIVAPHALEQAKKIEDII